LFRVRNLTALNLTRGLAAFAVLFGHLRGEVLGEYAQLPADQQNVVTAAFYAITRLGHEAVIVFFVLSGFLVGGQVLSRLREQRFDLTRYTIDRTTRIWLPLVPAILFTAAVDLAVHGQTAPVYGLIANMVGLNEVLVPSIESNAVVWSLAYEIWFYIAAGAVGYVVSNGRGLTAYAVLLICAVVFLSLKTHYVAFWILGAGASLLIHVRHRWTLFVSGALVAAVGCLFWQLGVESHAFDTGFRIIQPGIAEWMIGIGIAMTFPAMADASLNRIMQPIAPFATAIAAFSYTLYLTHRPTNNILATIFPNRVNIITLETICAYGLRVAICVLVATALYFCFERNTQAVRRIFKTRQKAVQPDGLLALDGSPRK
jgi:peptidoglycan/LPS O-acetylase OafA/YrhL